MENVVEDDDNITRLSFLLRSVNRSIKYIRLNIRENKIDSFSNLL